MNQMKKFLLMLLVAVVPMTVATSCSDDDDDPTLAEEIAGTYTAKAKVTEMPDLGEFDIDLSIVKTGKEEVTIKLGKIKVQLPVIGDTEIPLGDIEKVGLSGTNNNVTLKETKSTITVMPTITIDNTVSGTVADGKTLNLKSALDLSKIPGAEVEKINVTVTGTKK